MVKIQIDLTDTENKIVEIYKTINHLETKEQAIKQMIKTSEKSLVDGLKKGL